MYIDTQLVFAQQGILQRVKVPNAPDSGKHTAKTRVLTATSNQKEVGGKRLA